MKKQFKLSEYNLCSDDFVYFCSKYIKIKTNTSDKKIKFNLYKFQRDVLDSIEGNYINLIIKARQMGLSKLFLAYSLWNMLFNNDFSIVFIFMNTDILKNSKQIFDVMYNELPNFLKKDIFMDNKDRVEFSNGSIIYFEKQNNSVDKYCGQTLNLLFVDEAQFIKNLEEIFISTIPTILPDGHVILYSTPSEEQTFFRKLYFDNINSFNKIQIPWFFDKTKTHDFYKEMEQHMGKEMSIHELDAKF